MTQFLNRSTLLSLATAGVLFATGCATADTPETAQPDENTASDQKALGGPDGAHKKRRHMRGPGKILHRALAELDLNDAQRAEIGEQLDDLGPTAEDKAAHEKFRTELAAAVRAGSIDDAMLDAHKAKMKTRMEAKRKRAHEALSSLHATLTPEQRTELVASMREHKGKHGKHGKHGKMGRRHGKHGKHGKMGRRGGKMRHMMRDLNLTDAQRTKMKEAREKMGLERPDREAMRAKMKEHWEAKKARRKAMLDAFASPDFDPSKFAGGPPEHMKKRMGGHMKMLQAVVPILDDAQRNKLADKILAGPKHRRHHGPPPGAH